MLFLRYFHVVDVKSFLLYQIRLKNMSISENSSYLTNKFYKYELDINIKIYNIRVYLRYVKSYAIWSSQFSPSTHTLDTQSYVWDMGVLKIRSNILEMCL